MQHRPVIKFLIMDLVVSVPGIYIYIYSRREVPILTLLLGMSIYLEFVPFEKNISGRQSDGTQQSKELYGTGGFHHLDF